MENVIGNPGVLAATPGVRNFLYIYGGVCLSDSHYSNVLEREGTAPGSGCGGSKELNYVNPRRHSDTNPPTQSHHPLEYWVVKC